TRLPLPWEGAKSNPSKRHRDRLNQELGKLSSLLPFPEDVRARLDKLSVLRLIVGYLKVKNYFTALSASHQALDGFLVAVTEDGCVFYVSPTVQDYLGFHQSDVIYQSVFELIHKEDRATFQSQFLWPPDTTPTSRAEQDTCCKLPRLQHLSLEEPSYLERSFVCRFRCLLDNSSGFLELNFHGHLKFLPGKNNSSEDGIPTSPQLTLFAVATPRQPFTIVELQNKTVFFQTKHKLDFTPIACDSRGKVVLGYTDSELYRRGSGYQFIHAADAMYCAENHMRMIRPGESGLTVFRLLTKRAGWLWVQSNAHLVFRGGRPECIVARQRALTDVEGEDHLRKRALQGPFAFTTGEAILYESSLPGPLTALPTRKRTRARMGPPTDQGSVCTGALLGATRQQDESAYLCCLAPASRGSALERQGSHDKCEDKQEKGEEEEDCSLLTLIESLLEKDMEEQPDLCSTLQHLDVTDLDQSLWGKSLLRADSDTAGSQTCCLLPPSQERGPHSKEEALFHGSGNVGSPLPDSTTASQTPKPQSSLDAGQPAMAVTPPQNRGTVPNYLHAHTQHCLTSSSTLQSPPWWQPRHSQVAPLGLGMFKKPTPFDLISLPEAPSPSQSAQLFQSNCALSLPLGQNVPGHLAQPGLGNLDFCKESFPWTPSQSSQCQGPLNASESTSFANPCGTHSLDSIWDSHDQSQPVVVPVEVGAEQGAGEAQPDPVSSLWSTTADPCLLWGEPASGIPSNLCTSHPLVPHGALGPPQDTPGSQEQPPHFLGGSQLSGHPAYPPQALLHGPLATQGSSSAGLGLVTRQHQWVQMGLQTQEHCRQVREGTPGVQHLGGHLKDAGPQALQLSPFLSLESSSPGTGRSQGNSPAEPTRHSKDRLAIPAPSAVGQHQMQSSPAQPCLPALLIQPGHPPPCRAATASSPR
uniref:Aryl hydrocarbon receptor n=1 Tax=Moschus moschiferus TaxID=68415 RepID=A0A8C6FNH1_MOSMO